MKIGRKCFNSVLLGAMVVAVLAAGGAALAAEAKGGGKSRASAATGEAAGPVDLNSASADQLVEVPGIGESLARRIVEFRDKNGAFQSVDDLLKVQGIGEKSLQKLRPHLTVAKGH